MEEENVADHDLCFESSSGRDEEKVKALGLLEEGWFFGNLLKQKPRMSRCFSDPCPSSSSSVASPKEGKGLVRAPSLPLHLGREEEKKKSNGKGKVRALTRQLSDGNLILAPKPTCVENKKAIRGKRNDVKPKSRSNGNENGIGKSSLLRTPSLPVSLQMEKLVEEDENESDTTMSKLIWQAWADSSEIKTPKAVTQSPKTIPRSRPPRNLEAESLSANAIKEPRRQSLRPTTLKKCVSNIEYQDLQGFKDLGFKDVTKHDKARKSDLSKAWMNQSYGAKNSSEDMKAQIKFWARAVATNVRQEC